MKRIDFTILVLMILGWASLSQAQDYGNEWIQPAQRYFKLKVAEDGIYRISRTDLVNAGFPVGSINPTKIQMYYLGEEQAIRVSGEGDGSFDTNDFIEFYGRKSDGTTDTELYVSPEAQPHTYFNLYADSAAYFLTFSLDLTNGLRMSNFFENNSGNLSAESYFYDEPIQVFSSSYYEGQSYGSRNEVILGYYDTSEGWTGVFRRRGESIEHVLTGLGNWVDDSGTPQLELLLTGGNNNAHNVSIFVGPTSASTRLIHTAEFTQDETYLMLEDIQWSDISGSGELYVRATVNGVDGAADRAAISYIKLRYSRNFNLGGIASQKMELVSNPGGKSFISVSNIGSGPMLYDITQPSAPISIGYNSSGGNISAIVDNTLTSRTLFIESSPLAISGIKEVTIQSFDPADYNYLIVTHPSLRQSTSEGDPDPVAAYQAYRESSAGGGHQVLISEIEDLFNQFNYGNPSPMAIRRFCHYMYDEGSPEYLFLIGKSSNVWSRYYRQDPTSTTIRHFVPTFGHPGADVPFSSGFDDDTPYETIATGRINADSPDDVQAYLNKAMEDDAVPYNTLRRKNLVHLSGGNSEAELNTFRTYINGFADAAADKWLGGESAQISKNNNTAVELINISDEINEGVIMVTFFGHSSGSVTDIEIGLVSDPSFGYSNKGKYPVFMVNGCLAGDFFSENESFGVDWVLTPDLGATAFMAHSHVAFPTYLRRYTNLFYQLAFNDADYITRTVGEIKMESGRYYDSIYTTNSTAIAQIQLVNLQGDPAVRVFGADKPDFSLDDNLIEFESFGGSPILATTDSFLVSFNVKNFGIGTDSVLNIQVRRTLANGTRIDYSPRVYEATLREDTLQYVIYNDFEAPGGNNTFEIVLDPFDEIDELNELNNSVSVDLFLIDGSTLNLLPEPYAIVNSEQVEFFFQSSNILTDARDYDFQLDINNSFNSSSLISQTLNAEVVGRLPIDLSSFGALADGTVLYWRTRFTDPAPNESSDWSTSSFVLDRSKTEGWANRSIPQLSSMSLDGLTIDPNNGLWEFLTTELNIRVTNYGSSHPTNNYQDTEVLIDGQNYFATNSTLTNAHCSDNSINFVAFKRQSSLPFSPFFFNTAPELNPWICGRLPEYIYDYVPSEMDGTYGPMAFIDALENGDKILIFSLGNVAYSTWSTELKDQLATLGINRTVLDELADNEPVIMLGAKNAPTNSARIERADPPVETASLTLDEDVIGDFDSGRITTQKIGPAMDWQRFTMSIDDSDNPAEDYRNLRLVGVSSSGTEIDVYESITSTDVDLGPSGLNLDPDQYPYLRVVLELSDTAEFTPGQLQNWEVEYETAPELVLLKPDRSDLEEQNQIQEGAPYSSDFTLWNISNKVISDSVQVDYNLFSRTTAAAYLDSIMVPPLGAGDSTNITLPLSTFNKVNSHDLIVKANDQKMAEKYLLNNEIRLSSFLDVLPDQINPVLEVTFDGMIIMDGDIVSPAPLIDISIADENPYILKEDTLGINFYLKRPGEEFEYERIPFSSGLVTWSPATQESSFEIQYRPESLENGLYGFRVQAVDGSGNESGIQPYEITFEVINESTITNFYPYPNPFSTRTQFVFTLTGSEIPEDIKIQILTISGRVVREIFMSELGPIRIGNNKTEFAWDGTDRYGDQLANGVYLYRVMIKNPGSDFEHRDTAGDRGFKNGFGKMYLLR